MSKKKIIVAVVVVYMCIALGLCYVNKKENNLDNGEIIAENVTNNDDNNQVEKDDYINAGAIYSSIETTVEYGMGSQNDIYVGAEDLEVLDTDKISILSRYALPSLERMSDEDSNVLMSNIQVLKKIDMLGIDSSEFYTPEYNWKAIYNESINTVKDALTFDDEVAFTGTTATELNDFLQKQSNVVVTFAEDEIYLDDVINIPSNIVLNGNGVVLNGNEDVTYAMLIENAENIGIYNFKILGGSQYGIYVIDSQKLLIYGNEIANQTYKAICVMNDNQYVNIVKNDVHDNLNGAIFFDGDITDCIIQGNSVYQNQGSRNLTAGIVFSSMIVADVYTAYNEFLDEYLYDLQKTPNHNILMDNLIQGNYSSGFYCDGGYLNYVIDNTIEDNEKEGMCLDYGTFGTYVSGNTIQRNGNRNRQTDEDLEADFILAAGRLEDGSSTAKLPGVSIDNSAYNIIYNNTIAENSGSGVKMVRSGYRNIILSNLIVDNNAGENEAYHGFGVELGYASEPDEPVNGLDFTADYENIIARNIISGHHYSGIYLAADVYCNDLIDNVIMDCEQFSVENFSEYFNSAVGNNTNIEALNFEF